MPTKSYQYKVTITNYAAIKSVYKGKNMRSETVKFNCKVAGCGRVSFEAYLNEKNVPVIKIKNNRHDGETHEPEFEISEILKEISNLQIPAAAAVLV